MKNLMPLIMLTCTIAQCSYAEGLLQKLTQHQSTQGNPYTTYTRGKVANFTNHWIGTCTSGNGQAEPFTLNIQNTANFIRIGEELLDIGVFATRAASAPSFNAVQHYDLQWSEDGQQLIGNFAMIAKSNPSGPFEIASGQATLSLENGKLIVKITPKTEAPIECTLSAVKPKAEKP